jgi:hypothetical protein
MIRFAIIGCGRIAQRHAEHIHGKGKLVAVCDVVKERADKIAAAYGSNAYYDVKELLEKDISESKSYSLILEKAVEERTMELERANKKLAGKNSELEKMNIELEAFAYVSSHDLQEPLRMIVSYLQLIEARYTKQLDSDAREFIDFAIDGAKRMKNLIEGLLARAGVTMEAVDYFLCHQPNRFMLQKLAEKMKIPYAKMPNNVVEHFGNSSGATIPVAIALNLAKEVTTGSKQVCLAGFGGGLTWSAMLMRLGGLSFCEMIDYPNGAGA